MTTWGVNAPHVYLSKQGGKMFTTFGVGVFAGMWVMAGCAIVASFKND
jgi:hypothetical protein